MLFTDSIFWWFFCVVALLLFTNVKTVKSNTLQSIVLLVASYFFYGYWDARFLALIGVVSLQTYIFGYLIFHEANRKKRQLYLSFSVAINVVVLGFFKYFGFFVEIVNDVNNVLGNERQFNTLDIILPVGISFYIFQTLTFVVDIYFRKIHYFPSALNYFTYVAFFPQLVAGPIERAVNLLPQFTRLVEFKKDNILTGIKLVIFGLFLKMVVADQLAGPVDNIFGDYVNRSSMELLLGVLYFSAQIYGDFCGYSTVAIGVARIIGFDLMSNFNAPYLSTSISAFWRRWHISLSTFFRDYVYIPLGGNRGSFLRVSAVIMITFLVSGLWHGAAWGFVVWGGIHGALLVFERGFRRVVNLDAVHNKFAIMGIHFAGWLITMFFVAIAWVFFRQVTLQGSLLYIEYMVVGFSLYDLRMLVEILVEHADYLILLIVLITIDFIWLHNTRIEKPIFANCYIEDLFFGVLLAFVLNQFMLAQLLQNFIYFQF